MRHPLAAAARVRFRRVFLSFAVLSGVALTGGLPTEARANDDAGMMVFALSAGAPRPPAHVILQTPSYRQVSPYVARPALQPIRFAHQKPARRLVAFHPHIKVASRPVASDSRHKPQPGASGPSAIHGRPSPESAHLSDKTLRAGDIVATAAGLRVFRGSSQFPFRDADFAALAAADKVQNRAVLEALDRTMRRGEVSRHQIALQAPKVAAQKVQIAHAADAPTAPVAGAAKPAARPAARAVVATTSAKPAARAAGPRGANAYAPAVRVKEPASAVRAIERVLKRDGALRMQAAAPRKVRQARVWRAPQHHRAVETVWAVAPVRMLAPSHVGFWR